MSGHTGDRGGAQVITLDSRRRRRKPAVKKFVAPRWRFFDIADGLLPVGCTWRPPAAWRSWNEPRPPLPIDQAVTALAKRSRAPALRLPADLAGRGIHCPYWAARFAVALAVDAATMTSADDPKEMARRWKARADKARKACNLLFDIAWSRASSAPYERWPRITPPLVRTAFTDIARAVGALHHLKEHCQTERQVYVNKQPDAWRLTFVADLGFFWRMLTGASPANSEPFIGFVESAWDSLGREAVTWDHSVRRAVMLYGNHWERYDRPA